jgi:hypothetical protein
VHSIGWQKYTNTPIDSWPRPTMSQSYELQHRGCPRRPALHQPATPTHPWTSLPLTDLLSDLGIRGVGAQENRRTLSTRSTVAGRIDTSSPSGMASQHSIERRPRREVLHVIPTYWPYSPETYQAFAALKKAGFTTRPQRCQACQAASTVSNSRRACGCSPVHAGWGFGRGPACARRLSCTEGYAGTTEGYTGT